MLNSGGAKIAVVLLLFGLGGTVQAQELQDYMIGQWRIMHESENHYREVIEDDFLVPTEVRVLGSTGGTPVVQDYRADGTLVVSGRVSRWDVLEGEDPSGMRITTEDGLVTFVSVNPVNENEAILVAAMLFDNRNGVVLLMYSIQRIQPRGKG